MSSFDHIILYSLLFFVFFLFAKKGKENGRNFVLYATLAILSFTIIEGLRYGRGPDYLSYKYRFEHISPSDEPQKGFLWLMQLLNFLGFNYIGLFMTYALIFIAGMLLFIRKTFPKEYTCWMFFCILLCTLAKSENLIRQYLAMPFVFFAITNLLRRKWCYVFVFVIIANSIHSGVMFLFFCFLIAYLVYQKKEFILSYKLSIPFLFIAYYIIPQGLLNDTFISILSGFDMDSVLATDHFQHYIEDSDRWLGADSFLEAAEQTPLTKTLQFIFDASILISGYITLKKHPDKNIAIFYNLVAVGFFFERLFFGFEIFQRMTGQLYILWFVVIGYVLSNLELDKKLQKGTRIYMYAIACYQVMYWGRFVFFYPDSLFVWSK